MLQTVPSLLILASLLRGIASGQTAPEKADTDAGVLGDFTGPTHSVVRVHACGASVCLTLVQLPPKPVSIVDGHNPNEALRKRPLCGLDIGTGFRQQDATHLVDGQIYDPISGKTYKSTVSSDGDKLKLRGYIGISMFGRTETWTRVPPVAVCQ